MNNNKRNLELTSINSLDYCKTTPSLGKKLNTPISEYSLGNFTSERMDLEQYIIGFITEEIEYYKNLRLIITIFKSLLDHNEKYKNILTKSEKNLVFEDIKTLGDISKRFLIEITKSLVTHSIIQGKYDLNIINDDKFLNFNIPHLVYNCKLEKFNIGTIFKSAILDNESFKCGIIKLTVKYDFTVKILNGKATMIPLVHQWLIEGKRLINPNCNSLVILLLKPLDRLHRYPSQLKKIMDVVDDQYDLNLSLVKVNKLIDTSKEFPKLDSWEQLRDFNNQYLQLKYQFNNNLEFLVDPRHEFKLETSKYNVKLHQDDVKTKLHHGIKGKYTPNGQVVELINQFTFQYKAIIALHRAFKLYTKTLEKFAQIQQTYLDNWKGVLQGEVLLDSMIVKYQEKIKLLMVIMENFTQLMTSHIIQPLVKGLGYITQCHHRIDHYNKLKFQQEIHLTFSWHQFIDLEGKLQRQLPTLTRLMTSWVELLVIRFNSLNCGWLKTFIGDTKIKEFHRLRQTMDLHDDIVDFYYHQLALSDIMRE